VSPIAFIDLAAQRRRLGDAVDRAIARVLDHHAFIQGPEVAVLEQQLAAFCGARHVVTCANGTDALALAMTLTGVGRGDAVLVPAFTFVATAEVIPPTGAVPLFVDVSPDSFTLDPASLADGIATAGRLGLTPRAVVPVDLFGQPADYRQIGEVAAAHRLTVIADAAQAFGGALDGRRVGTLAPLTTVSFFPAKPLGCYGDGGALITDDEDAARLLRSLASHGKGAHKYDNVRIGINSRLDTLQAAILLEKLAIFEEELAARGRVAARYGAGLAGRVQVPRPILGARSAWAQYTLVVPERDRLIAACRAAGVPTAVYYPIPLNQQTGYRDYPCASGGVPVSERLARQVVSLPMHPYLDEATQDRIIEAVISGLA
jgi:dTDP-4-amino-4,6-dideoxygalactose transaminase